MAVILVGLLAFHVCCLQFLAAVRQITVANECPQFVDTCQDANGLTCDNYFTIEKKKGEPDGHIFRALATAPTIGFHCAFHWNVMKSGCKQHTWAGQLEVRFYQKCACALHRQHPQRSQFCSGYAGIWFEEVEAGRALCKSCMAGTPMGDVFPSLDRACVGDELTGVMTIEALESCSLRRPNGPQPMHWEPPRPVPAPKPDRWAPAPQPYPYGWAPAPQSYRPAPQPAPRPYRPPPQPYSRPAPPESPARGIIQDLQQQLNSARLQDKAAKKRLFFTLIRKWHPDKHEGDEDVANEVTSWLTNRKDNFFDGRMLSES